MSDNAWLQQLSRNAQRLIILILPITTKVALCFICTVALGFVGLKFVVPAIS